jgi:hypothetical protein
MGLRLLCALAVCMAFASDALAVEQPGVFRLPAASFGTMWPSTAKLLQSPGPEARVPQMPKSSPHGAA